MTDIIQKPPEHFGVEPSGDTEQLARQEAIRQIERRRRFWVRTVMFSIVMVLLIVIWAVNEYHNAGGWPSQGFSQSSGIHHVWNSWIIYPLVAWIVGTATHAWLVFGHKPISEADIQREMDRQDGMGR